MEDFNDDNLISLDKKRKEKKDNNFPQQEYREVPDYKKNKVYSHVTLDPALSDKFTEKIREKAPEFEAAVEQEAKIADKKENEHKGEAENGAKILPFNKPK